MSADSMWRVWEREGRPDDPGQGFYVTGLNLNPSLIAAVHHRLRQRLIFKAVSGPQGQAMCCWHALGVTWVCSVFKSKVQAGLLFSRACICNTAHLCVWSTLCFTTCAVPPLCNACWRRSTGSKWSFLNATVSSAAELHFQLLWFELKSAQFLPFYQTSPFKTKVLHDWWITGACKLGFPGSLVPIAPWWTSSFRFKSNPTWVSFQTPFVAACWRLKGEIWLLLNWQRLWSKWMAAGWLCSGHETQEG